MVITKFLEIIDFKKNAKRCCYFLTKLFVSCNFV